MEQIKQEIIDKLSDLLAKAREKDIDVEISDEIKNLKSDISSIFQADKDITILDDKESKSFRKFQRCNLWILVAPLAISIFAVGYILWDYPFYNGSKAISQMEYIDSVRANQELVQKVESVLEVYYEIDTTQDHMLQRITSFPKYEYSTIIALQAHRQTLDGFMKTLTKKYGVRGSLPWIKPR